MNRTSHVAEWVRLRSEDAEEDTYVFGVHKGFVAAAVPGTRPASRWATSCRDAVYVLKAAPAPHANPALVLGSYSGDLEVWRAVAEKGAFSWRCDVAAQSAHSASITALGVVRDAMSVARSASVFATGSTDNTLKIWELTRGDTLQADVVQAISLGGRYALDIALAHLPNGDEPLTTLMAVALTDKKVHLYAREAGGEFTLRLQLEGHEDWVRALDFCVAPSVRGGAYDVHLASAAQDNNVRVWRIQAESVAGVERAPADAFERMAAELLPDDDQGINTKKNWLSFAHASQRWAVSLDAMLVGHDAWVTGVRWFPSPSADAQRAVLLSSSVDNSMILWSPQEPGATEWPLLSDEAASRALWLPVHRLGDVGSLSGGFLGAAWQPTTSRPAVLTYDRQGAAHVWALADGQQRFLPGATLSGHAGPARGLAWEPYGDYFLSTGYVPRLTQRGPHHTLARHLLPTGRRRGRGCRALVARDGAAADARLRPRPGRVARPCVVCERGGRKGAACVWRLARIRRKCAQLAHGADARARDVRPRARHCGCAAVAGYRAARRAARRGDGRAACGTRRARV